jgi:hypothetical protein
MEASKVSFTAETSRQMEAPLTRPRYTELRRANILAYIRDKPNGTPIATRELAEVSQNRSYQRTGKTSAINGFIKNMECDGLLILETIPGSRKRRYYPTAGPRPPASNPRLERQNGAACQQEPEGNRTLTDMAKDFAWSHDSDSLREFVAWMDGQELDLRRMIDQGKV